MRRIELLRAQVTTLASELASLQELIGRSSRKSSKPTSNDGLALPLRRSPYIIQAAREA